MKESRGMTFAAGFITCFVILLGIKFFFGGSNINSERILRLQRDSVEYVRDKDEQAKKYALIDSLYREAMDSLSLLSKSAERRLHDRPRRTLSLDPDSVLMRMRSAAGLPATGLPPDLKYRRRGVR